MNAYLMQERIEERKWDEHQAEIEKEDWINKRGNELLNDYPDCPYYLIGSNLPADAKDKLLSPKGIEAYVEYISKLAWLRAEDEWEEKYGWLAD